MSTDIGKAYELLGVKPGVSARELKAAHRDLAKVWHPDRFVHDPGLREKAQEKLKEINAAYELLVSGKRPPPPPRYPTQPPVVRRQSPRRRPPGLGLALLMFMAVFAVTVSVLLQSRQNRAPAVEIATQDVSAPADESASRSRQRQTAGSSNKAAPESASGGPSVAPLATVTVVIDPYTRLLATPNCPVSTSMTYPSGNQPQAYCRARHPPRVTALATEPEPEKDSVVKSIAKRVGF